MRKTKRFVTVQSQTMTGLVLDWAVGRALNGSKLVGSPELPWGHSMTKLVTQGLFNPSTDWLLGGKLFDLYKPWVTPPVNDPDPSQPYGWDAQIYDEAGNEIIGEAIGCDTVLIALCRAIVVAVLGEEVQVPAVLVYAA